jgi:DNA (cytosine-5)-methyltransferase 1
MNLNSVELFAGVGGWTIAAREIGYDPLGIEIDESACATRKAAGMRTLRGDVRLCKAVDFPCELLLASPPCQYFSASSPRRKIVSDKPYNVKRRMKWRAYSDEGPDLIDAAFEWARQVYPTYLAFENVPGALAYWNSFALELQDRGYKTWAGILNAQDHGVPQDRARAILMARRDGALCRPPTNTARPTFVWPTIVCNRRSAGGIVLGRSIKGGGTAVSFERAGEIQTFPADFPWQGGVEAKSRQIGNALPPNLGKAILHALSLGAHPRAPGRPLPAPANPC